nr:hypothetical protein [Sphingobium sp.]
MEHLKGDVCAGAHFLNALADQGRKTDPSLLFGNRACVPSSFNELFVGGPEARRRDDPSIFESRPLGIPHYPQGGDGFAKKAIGLIEKKRARIGRLNSRQPGPIFDLKHMTEKECEIGKPIQRFKVDLQHQSILPVPGSP